MTARLIAERIAATLPAEQQDPLFAYALWFMLWASEQGHTAIDSSRAQPLVDAFQHQTDTTDCGYDLQACLRDWSMVSPEDLTAQLPDLLHTPAYKPITASQNMLWLQRLFVAEQQVATAILGRSLPRPAEEDHAGLQDIRFGEQGQIALSPGQQEAVRAARHQSMLLLTGGPGTGKTTVVSALLLGLAQQEAFWAHEDEAAPILLAAPTGKAASRMNQSLQQTLQHVRGVPDGLSNRLLATLATHPATTLHRLLGASNRPGGGYFYGAHNPLPPASVLVVDEASMIDLPLMQQLLAALDPDTRLLLLGDPHQLPAVGLGSVLADLARAPALTDQHVHLQTSHRFPEDSHIYQTKQTILGQPAGAVSAADNSYVEMVDIPDTENPWQAYEQAIQHWMAQQRPWDDKHSGQPFDCMGAAPQDYFEMDRAFSQYRVLTALRQGPAGQQAANTTVEAILQTRFGLVDTHYNGRPLMLLQNSYSGTADLFNGDIGFLRGGGLQCEPRPGMPETIGLAALPAHELCYATTVHKSQGSEFQHILLLLPPELNPVVTRELLYTAVTRVKVPANGTGGITIVGPAAVYEAAVAISAERHTGLPALLEALR